MAAIITEKFRQHNAEQFFESFSEASKSTYYLFVGKATAKGFSKNTELFVVDPLLGTNLSDLKEFMPEFIFLCLPTPMKKDGSQDFTLVEEVLREILFIKLLIYKNLSVAGISSFSDNVYINGNKILHVNNFKVIKYFTETFMQNA